jgi:hypothetical protein
MGRLRSFFFFFHAWVNTLLFVHENTARKLLWGILLFITYLNPVMEHNATLSCRVSLQGLTHIVQHYAACKAKQMWQNAKSKHRAWNVECELYIKLGKIRLLKNVYNLYDFHCKDPKLIVTIKFNTYSEPVRNSRTGRHFRTQKFLPFVLDTNRLPARSLPPSIKMRTGSQNSGGRGKPLLGNATVNISTRQQNHTQQYMSCWKGWFYAVSFEIT